MSGQAYELYAGILKHHVQVVNLKLRYVVESGT